MRGDHQVQIARLADRDLLESRVLDRAQFSMELPDELEVPVSALFELERPSFDAAGQGNESVKPQVAAGPHALTQPSPEQEQPPPAGKSDGSTKLEPVLRTLNPENRVQEMTFRRSRDRGSVGMGAVDRAGLYEPRL